MAKRSKEFATCLREMTGPRLCGWAMLKKSLDILDQNQNASTYQPSHVSHYLQLNKCNSAQACAASLAITGRFGTHAARPALIFAVDNQQLGKWCYIQYIFAKSRLRLQVLARGSCFWSCLVSVEFQVELSPLPGHQWTTSLDTLVLWVVQFRHPTGQWSLGPEPGILLALVISYSWTATSAVPSLGPVTRAPREAVRYSLAEAKPRK